MTLPSNWKESTYPNLDVDGVLFSEIMNLGDNYEVYDFTQGYDENRVLEALTASANTMNYVLECTSETSSPKTNATFISALT